MAKYIDKAVAVAEIERKRNLCKQILLRSRTRQDDDYHQGNIEAYEVVISLLDTLEVKEVDEEPTSNDLEEAAYQFGNCFENHFGLASMSFIKGAKWQKEQLMENAVEAVIHPYDGEIWVDKDLLSIYDDCQRVKLIIIKEK